MISSVDLYHKSSLTRHEIYNIVANHVLSQKLYP